MGLDARLQVSAAVFARGAFPEAANGPAVLGVYLARTTLEAGEQGRHVSGIVDASSTAVLVGLEGDVGVWQVPVSVPPPEAPDSLGFVANLSLSRTVPVGEHRLFFWAVDEVGRVGARSQLSVDVVAAAAPEASLVVTLRWEGQADLDLHVVLPDGSEVFSGDPVLRGEGGELLAYLDVDANADCVFDGRGQENVVFEARAPVGTYVVRVETRSSCGTPSAPFTVTATQEGRSLGTAQGTGLAIETRFARGRGAGEHVLTFDVP